MLWLLWRNKLQKSWVFSWLAEKWIKRCKCVYRHHWVNTRNQMGRSFYCPQAKFAKVMFLHVSVILSRGGCLFLGGPAPGGVCSRGSAWSRRGCLVPGGGGECLVGRPPQTATAAGGTHPTGMHSWMIWRNVHSFGPLILLKKMLNSITDKSAVESTGEMAEADVEDSNSSQYKEIET